MTVMSWWFRELESIFCCIHGNDNLSISDGLIISLRSGHSVTNGICCRLQLHVGMGNQMQLNSLFIDLSEI